MLRLLLIVLFVALSGCAIHKPWVKPYERDYIADPLMAFEALAWQPGAISDQPGQDYMYYDYPDERLRVVSPAIFVTKKLLAERLLIRLQQQTATVKSSNKDTPNGIRPDSETVSHYGLGVGYFHQRKKFSLFYSHRSEDDYAQSRWYVGVSQRFFGDLTLLGLGFSLASGEVKATPIAFKDTWHRRGYYVSLSQVIAKRLLLAAAFEAQMEAGYLQNPYRKASVIRAGVSANDRSQTWEAERYPKVRSKDRLSLELRYYLPYRAVFRVGARRYADSWKRNGYDWHLAYQHPLNAYPLSLSFSYRGYHQKQALFFYDVINGNLAASLPELYGRDKAMSAFDSATFALGIAWRMLDEAELSLEYEHTRFDYKDYRNTWAADSAIGEEPLLQQYLAVMRCRLSLTY